MSKSDTDKERNERLERENFCQELFFSFISPQLENSKPDTKLKPPNSDQIGSSDSADSVQRSIETLNLGAIQNSTEEDVPCSGSADHAATGTSKGIVVSKECNGCWL